MVVCFFSSFCCCNFVFPNPKLPARFQKALQTNNQRSQQGGIDDKCASRPKRGEVFISVTSRVGGSCVDNVGSRHNRLLQPARGSLY